MRRSRQSKPKVVGPPAAKQGAGEPATTKPSLAEVELIIRALFTEEPPAPGDSFTERELIERACTAVGLPLAKYLRRAMLLSARRDLSLDNTRKATPPNTLAQGVPGVASDRIEKAYQLLLAAGEPITPARLNYRSKAGFRPCKTWMERKGLVT